MRGPLEDWWKDINVGREASTVSSRQGGMSSTELAVFPIDQSTQALARGQRRPGLPHRKLPFPLPYPDRLCRKDQEMMHGGRLTDQP